MSKKQSIEEIYQQNRNWIYGSFLKKVGHIETAEDLSQTLWLKFFRNYENLNLKHEKVLRTYLRSMVLHASADYYRSLQRSEDLMQELENPLAENSGHKDAVHDEAFPEDSMNDIETIYKELNDEERLLIYLKYGIRIYGNDTYWDISKRSLEAVNHHAATKLHPKSKQRTI